LEADDPARFRLQRNRDTVLRHQGGIDMSKGATTALGVALGAAYGALNGNLALSLAIGTAIGAVIEFAVHAAGLGKQKPADPAKQP
jgi:hypothetical protein